MNNAIIEVQNLSKNFGEIHAVNELSFTVMEGDVYGFLGQNGAGKSTTIRMMLTLIQPTDGSIRIFGKELLQNRKDILQQTGAIIERPDLYEYLSAYDNLSIFARLSGIKPSHKMLMDQLDKVGIADRAKSKVETFSQGMKQRLGIAIAMIHDPKLIILDEPTNGLDPQGIADIRNMIIDLRKTHKKTVIVSSHLLYEIEQVATRMLIIDKGKKVVEGSIEELFNPADTLVELETSDSDALQKIQASKWADHLQPHLNHYTFKLHKENIPVFAKDIVDMDIRIYNLNKQHSLENLFLNLTKKE